MLRTCKRCIRTGVNDLSGLYNGASPYLGLATLDTGKRLAA